MCTYRDALKEICDAIKLLGQCRKASDMAACDLDYDGSGDDWKEYWEPMIMEPYERAMRLLDSDAHSEEGE